MRAAPLISSLNAGELGPTLDGRTDLPKYSQGAKLSENFLHLVQGPARRRGGSKFVETVKNHAHRSWDVKFEFNATQAFVLEFGDLYVRFFAQRGQLLSGFVPYEIVSPYPIADLTMDDGTCALDVEQSGDVLYIAHKKRTYKPKTLTRLANLNWVFADYAPNQGPFESLNTGAITLQSSGSTGTPTITASAPLFAVTDVGRLLRMEVQDLDVKPWETNKAYALNDLVRSDGKTYKASNAATSGTEVPVHDHGNAYDGKTGVQWQYQDAGYGIARIASFSSTTSVTATVVVDEINGLKQLPADVVTTATKRWQLGAWSDTTGWPGSVTFWENRLWWFMRLSAHGSVPNDFSNMSEDFFGEVRDDCAINHTLQGQDVNEILWGVGDDKLVIGTGGGEYVGGQITDNLPLSPSNFRTKRQSKHRARDVDPVSAGTSLLYVQRAGRKLLSFDYSLEIDRYRSSDQNLLNDRVTRSGIIQLCFQGEPDSIIWSVLANGKLAGFTIDAEQNVGGWGPQRLGGTDVVVECAVSIPSPDGLREDLWLTVRRTINGSTVRYHEYMTAPWDGPDEDGTGGDDQADAFYVDCGLTYDGAAATIISGLSHLEGQTVQVFGDGAVMPDQIVTGGAITLPRAVSRAQIGLQYISRLVPMRIEVQTDTGTSVGKMKRANAATLRFVDTLGGKAGTYRGRLEPLSVRSAATAMNTGTEFRSGDAEATFGGNNASDGLLEVRQEQCLPMTLAAIAPRMSVEGPE